VIIAVDFDGTIVKHNHHATEAADLVPRDGALEALRALKRAGHTLLLYSARANRALRIDPDLDPLVRAGIRRVDREAWLKAQPLHQRRFHAMAAWAATNLPGVFDAIDDGGQGKPDVDLFIDDKALSAHSSRGGGWPAIAHRYG
jgi:hypothetical protein